MTNFCFKSEVTAFDFWKSSMRKTYKSLAGVINIVFTGAIFLLAFKLLSNAKLLEQSLMVLGCIWFPLIQPIIVYFTQRKVAKLLPKDLVLNFSEKGMKVKLGNQEEEIPWKKFDHIEIEPGMVIFFSDARHGYIVTNKTMGQKRDAFLSFVKQHC